MKKILKVDSTYRLIDGEGIEIQDTLPKGIYELKFGQRSGFWLEKIEMETFPGKVYGCQDRMTDKVIRKYATTIGRNLGVLISGHKGTGKSLFVRNLSVKMADEIPVIIIKNNHGPDMLSMLANIKGRCVLVFDEFEKMFRSEGGNIGSSTKENDIREQETALSFFDGVETKQEKLILLTVNETHLMSKYLLGRPGRIYYHFTMVVPSPEEIVEYLSDNLKSEFYSKSGDMDSLASRLSSRAVSWDSLSAVVTELNNGESIEDTLRDLNIHTDSEHSLNLVVTVTWDDGDEENQTVTCDSTAQDIKFCVQKCLERSKYGVDAMWTKIKFNVIDMVPGKLGMYEVSKFQVISNEDEEDKELANAPKIVRITVGRHSALLRASEARYSAMSLML